MSWLVVLIIVVILLILIGLILWLNIYPFTRYVGYANGCQQAGIKDDCNIGSAIKGTESDCADHCKSTPGCNQYQYTPDTLSGSNCWVKNVPSNIKMLPWSKGVVGVKHVL